MTLKLGMVGCGRISHAHGIATQRIGADKVRFTACMDVREESAAAFAKAYGCDRTYTDLARMLRDEELDGVVLATWPAQHREQIQQVAAAGHRFILCEKSLASSRDDVLAIWEIAQSKRLTVVEGFMYMHHPAIRLADRMVRDGSVGQVDWVRSASSFFFPEVASGDDPSRSWRFRKETGGGVPFDLTCYPVSACARYAGSLPKFVQGTSSLSPTYGTVNRLFGSITYESGCVGIVESSATAMFNQEIQINGSSRLVHLKDAFTPAGNAVVLEKHARKFAHVDERTHLVEVPLPVQDDLSTFYSYQPQLEHFLKVVGGEEAGHPSLAASVVNVLTLDALLLSAQRRQAVEIDVPPDVRASWAPALAASS